MPPTLTSRQLLWTGIVLTVVGLATGLYLMPLVFALGGNDALNSPALRWAQILLAQVAFQLGLALIVFPLIVRAIERNRLAAPRVVARMFWIGVALVVLGLIFQESLAAWQYDVSGAEDVGAGLARDILWLFGAPFKAVAVPLGVLLAAGSLVVRVLGPATEPVHGEGPVS